MEIKKHVYPIIGAIIGDIVGSPYELKGTRIKTIDFPLFNENSTYTDDTVLTLAIVKWLLGDRNNLVEIVRELGLSFFDVGFGHYFKNWLRSSTPRPYNSFGNGSAMRVSAIGVVAETIDEVMSLAEESAIITHNHPEGIKGAQAVATSVFLAYRGFPKECIKDFIQNQFSYNLDRSIQEIRIEYGFDPSCAGSVPEAIIAFLESKNVEEAIRLAVSLGGDADTQASIAGAIAAAYYKEIPSTYIEETLSRLPSELINILRDFNGQTISPIKTSYVITAKHDVVLNTYIRYTFAVAVTDETQVILPKDSKIFIECADTNLINDCHIISDKKQIFDLIEKQLHDKFGDILDSESGEPHLCNGVLLCITKDDLPNFSIRQATMDDILDMFLKK